jgi:hypothetical protein
MVDDLTKSGAHGLNRHFCRSALAIVFSLSLSLGASAETVAETVRKWGLIGSWARDCSVPADMDKGTVLAYEIEPGGRVVHRRYVGDIIDDNEVLSAEVSSNGILRLRVSFPRLKETREYGMLKLPDGTIRAMYNRNSKSEYTIRDGKFTANGNPTPPQHRCEWRLSALPSRSIVAE